jgi:hypothetical protein
VLSYGLGVDSTAILLRWDREPHTMPCGWEDLLVITAMTGDEWPESGQLVEQHILPILRRRGVRYVQVGRQERKISAGIAVLDDSRTPHTVHLAGQYRLSDEMMDAGTIPQSGGARLCSVHAKGDVLDAAIGQALGRWHQPYLHVMGFEANEQKRADKDAGYNTSKRTGFYPLIEWGWDRATCEAYIEAELGVAWPKSACVYCPFALANKAGRERVLPRYASNPAAAVQALLMEHTALALNPTQGLIGGKRLVDLLAGTPGQERTLAAFQRQLQRQVHAVYLVRRLQSPRARSIRKMATGPAAAMREHLDELAAAHGSQVETVEGGFLRVSLHQDARGEAFLVVAPATAQDKERPQFDTWWAQQMQLSAQETAA